MALYPHAEGGYWEYDTGGFPIVGGYDTDALEDFETQSLASYGGDTGSFRIQGTNVLQGRYSLESTAEQVSIGDNGTDLPTPRTSSATEYRARMVQQNSGDAALMTNVQATNWPWRDCYALLVDVSGNEIRLLSRESSSTRYLERKTVTGGLSSGTEYRPAINLTDEGINGKIYDRNGNLLAGTDSYRDLTHSGGGLGWMNGNGTTTYYDYASVEAGSMGDVSKVTLNDFEDGNLNEYRIVGGSSSGDQMVTPSAAYSGNYGLEMVDFGTIQTTPGMGADGYIRSGHPISFRMNLRALGNEQYYFTFGMSDADSTANTYKLQMIMGGGFRLMKNTGSGDNLISGSSSEGESVAACYNVNYSTGQWYEIVADIDESNGIRIDLLNPNGTTKAWVETPDTQLIDHENGYGHYCSGGGHYYLDEIVEV